MLCCTILQVASTTAAHLRNWTTSRTGAHTFSISERLQAETESLKRARAFRDSSPRYVYRCIYLAYKPTLLHTPNIFTICPTVDALCYCILHINVCVAHNITHPSFWFASTHGCNHNCTHACVDVHSSTCVIRAPVN